MKPHRFRFTRISAVALILVASQEVRAEVQIHKVEITGFKFVPATLETRSGDRIVFINKDVVPHTATQKPTGWDSGKLTKGMSWTLEVGSAGTFDYFCRFHPNMKAKITVK